MRRPGLPTPTPWQIMNEYEPTLIIGNVDGPSDGVYSFATIADTNDRDVNELDVDAANAAYIVKCVNAHDELVAFVRSVGDYCEDAPMGDRARDLLAKVDAA